MYLPQETAERNSGVENAFAERFRPHFLELRRKSLFARFLREELSACRTEAEREVVLAVLLATEVRILQLTKKFNLPGKEGGSETSSSHHSVETGWKSSWDTRRLRKRHADG